MRCLSMVMIACVVGISGVAQGQDAFAGKPRTDLEVILDLKNKLALVPEGTVIPRELKLWAQWSSRGVGERRFERIHRDEGAVQQAFRNRNAERSAPFVFRYAPASAFERYGGAKHPGGRLKPTSGYCSGYLTVHVEHPDPECQGCSMTLYHEICFDTDSGLDYLETYDADVTPAYPGYTSVGISSTDSYWSCFNGYSAMSDLSCWTSDTRHNTYPTLGPTIYVTGYNEFWQNYNVYTLEANATWGSYSSHRNP